MIFAFIKTWVASTIKWGYKSKKTKTQGRQAKRKPSFSFHDLSKEMLKEKSLKPFLLSPFTSWHNQAEETIRSFLFCFWSPPLKFSLLSFFPPVPSPLVFSASSFFISTPVFVSCPPREARGDGTCVYRRSIHLHERRAHLHVGAV